MTNYGDKNFEKNNKTIIGILKRLNFNFNIVSEKYLKQFIAVLKQQQHQSPPPKPKPKSKSKPKRKKKK
jgi:hypothetical protein